MKSYVYPSGTKKTQKINKPETKGKFFNTLFRTKTKEGRTKTIQTANKITPNKVNKSNKKKYDKNKKEDHPNQYNTQRSRSYQYQHYAPKNQPQYYPPYLRDRPVYYEEYFPRQFYAPQYLPNNAYYYEEYIPQQAFTPMNPQQYGIISPQQTKQPPDYNYVRYNMPRGNQMLMPQSIYNKNYMPISSSLKGNSKLINKDNWDDVAYNYKK